MGKKPVYVEIEGMRWPSTFLPEVLRSAKEFQAGPGDVVVATYPKCGTTWAIQIALLILRKGHPPRTSEEYFSYTPFLEMVAGDQISHRSKPGIIKTHLSFEYLNFSHEAKYIYVARHPEDCVVSFYHHTKFFPVYFFSDGTFDDYFELFIKGEVDFGDYFDHLLSWYAHRYEKNILFITYEDMKSDTRNAVLQIARFLGDEYYNCLVDNEEVLENVLRYSSLEYMKSTVDVFWKESFLHMRLEDSLLDPVRKRYAEVLEEAERKGHQSIGDFIRKGVVGEGKIILSKEQIQKLNEYIREKTKHSDVMDLWETN